MPALIGVLPSLNGGEVRAAMNCVVIEATKGVREVTAAPVEVSQQGAEGNSRCWDLALEHRRPSTVKSNFAELDQYSLCTYAIPVLISETLAGY